MHHYTIHRLRQSGLTLVEMLVVIAIVMVVAAILLFKYGDFVSNVSIRGLTQQVALTIRKGQTYATSARTVGTFSTENFSSYGVAFSTDQESDDLKNRLAPSDKRFIIFADINGNKRYDNNSASCGVPTDGNECVEALSITSSDRIGSIDVDAISPSGVTIMFNRPVSDATIYADKSATPASFTKIHLVSIKNVTKTITVWNTGQISVE